MILGRDILTALGLDIKFCDKIIIGGEGPYYGYLAPMVYLSNHNFASMTDKIIKL